MSPTSGVKSLTVLDTERSTEFTVIAIESESFAASESSSVTSVIDAVFVMVSPPVPVRSDACSVGDEGISGLTPHTVHTQVPVLMLRGMTVGVPSCVTPVGRP